jgi:hypothetical protein
VLSQKRDHLVSVERFGFFLDHEFRSTFARPHNDSSEEHKRSLWLGSLARGWSGGVWTGPPTDCTHFSRDWEVSGKADAQQSKDSMPIETRSARNGAEPYHHKT